MAQTTAERSAAGWQSKDGGEKELESAPVQLLHVISPARRAAALFPSDYLIVTKQPKSGD